MILVQFTMKCLVAINLIVILINIKAGSLYGTIRLPNERQGFVQEEYTNAKFLCKNEEKRVQKVASKMQCIHRCLRILKCGIVNYISLDGTDNVCEIFEAMHDESVCDVSYGYHRSFAIILKLLKPPIAAPEKDYVSCKDIYEDKNMTQDGVYKLKSGNHYCMMNQKGGCGGGGWTLAMTIDGTKDTFRAESPYWTTKHLLNEADGLQSQDKVEAKFPAFNSIRYGKVCIGMEYSGNTKWIEISSPSSSLLNVFQTGTYKATNTSRQTWKELIQGSSLQINCNRQGFNVKKDDGKLFARIGIIGNNENDCASPDSFIGFGTTKIEYAPANLKKISCGNFAIYASDGDRSFAAFGYLLIK